MKHLPTVVEREHSIRFLSVPFVTFYKPYSRAYPKRKHNSLKIRSHNYISMPTIVPQYWKPWVREI